MAPDEFLSLKRTPLCGLHEKAGARMVEFGGWLMPLQYEGILAEHTATRSKVTVFDTCHMGRIFVEGEGALDFLSRTMTQELRTLRDGRCRYGFLLKEDGGILDDLIVYRFNSRRFLVVVNAGTKDKDLAWLRVHQIPDVEIEDATAALAKLDLQGPRSCDLLAGLGAPQLRDLPFFGFSESVVAGLRALVSRTGYTGEDGFEIYTDSGEAAGLWERLISSGARPAGLGCRDTLRLEAGLPLYGHELSEDITPVEAGMERYASKSEDFTGRRAVMARAASGPTVRLKGLRFLGRQSARSGNPVLFGGRTVGRVASGSFAPSLGFSVATAFIEAGTAKALRSVKIDTGRTMLDAEAADPPFYRRERKREQS